jgi:hypothetical protein
MPAEILLRNELSEVKMKNILQSFVGDILKKYGLIKIFLMVGMQMLFCPKKESRFYGMDLGIIGK